MPTSESTGIARELKALDKDTWNRYETAIIGLLGKDKFPLLLERDEWVAERSSTAKDGEDGVKVASEEYDTASDAIHNQLSILFRMVPEVNNILAKYKAGRKIVRGDAEVLVLTADGAAAWKEMREVAMSGTGIETVERMLAELFGLEDGDSESARDLVTKHESLVRQIEEIGIDDIKLVWKHHLLKCVKQYGSDFDVVEHLCATDRTKTYVDTVRDIKARCNRLGSSNSTTGEGFSLEANQCRICGEFGHWGNECPHRSKGSKGSIT